MTLVADYCLSRTSYFFCIIRIDPGYIKAYYRRASAKYALGKLKEALKDFKAVVKIVPKVSSRICALVSFIYYLPAFIHFLFIFTTGCRRIEKNETM
jgi:tetratricopeptide (TPR) repeat protein